MNKLKRTRFDPIRECELDMRCLVRDMTERRILRDRIQKVRRRERHGYEIDDVSLQRDLALTKKLSHEILTRWARLHRRMNREKAKEERSIGKMYAYKEAACGDTAHP